MNKKIKIGLGIASVAVLLGAGHFAIEYKKEHDHLQRMANLLKAKRGDASSWGAPIVAEIPRWPDVADWRTDDVIMPQILFPVDNEDKTGTSIWTMNFNGTDLKLLIPEGEIAPLRRAATITRSPDGRYLILEPEDKGCTVYDLETKQEKSIGYGCSRSMWQLDSSKVWVQKGGDVIEVSFPGLKVRRLSDIAGEDQAIVSETHIAFSAETNRIYKNLEIRYWDLPSSYFSDEGKYVALFGEDLPKTGHTMVVDKNTLKFIDRGDFLPANCIPYADFSYHYYDCGWMEAKDGTRQRYIYSLKNPSKPIGNLNKINSSYAGLVQYRPGEVWYRDQGSFIRLLDKKEPGSPTTKMIYGFRYQLPNQKSISIRGYGIYLSKTVLEDFNEMDLGPFMPPLPTYAELDKASAYWGAK